VKDAAEQTKIALSQSTEHVIELPFLFTKGGQPGGYSKKITRTLFESLIEEKIHSTEQQIKTVLFDAELSAADIDLVLLVGGSTRIPLVTEFLRESFGFEPKALVDPDLAVVRGASLQGGVLSGDLDASVIVLTDVCPYSLSVEAINDAYLEPICDVLIKRNTTLPSSISRPYTTGVDNQEWVIISAYQGESIYPKDNILLSKMHLGGIPKAKAFKEKILVTYSYDLNGILTVSAEITSNGKSATITLDTSETVNLDLSAWKEAAGAKMYRRGINKAERLIKVNPIEDTVDLANAVDALKKGLILGWDEHVLSSLDKDLQLEISLYEEG
jgi:molecular chaperone DnaK